MFNRILRGLCAIMNGGHEWIILGSRLRCKKCNAHYTPPPKDVKLYPRQIMPQHKAVCDESNPHQWEVTRQGISVNLNNPEKEGYLEDYICKRCGQVERDVQPYEKDIRLGLTTTAIKE